MEKAEGATVADFFEELPALVPDNAEPVPINIESVGEVVESSFHAKKTVSPAEHAIRMRKHYGDLPEADREGRFEVERKFFAPKPDEVIHDIMSNALPAPHQCIIIGTNGHVSFAFQCPDEDLSEEAKKEVLDKEKKARQERKEEKEKKEAKEEKERKERKDKELKERLEKKKKNGKKEEEKKKEEGSVDGKKEVSVEGKKEVSVEGKKEESVGVAPADAPEAQEGTATAPSPSPSPSPSPAPSPSPSPAAPAEAESAMEKIARIEKDMDVYAKRNVAFAYKLASCTAERRAFAAYAAYELTQLHTSKEALSFLKDMMGISNIDTMLCLPIQKMGAELTKKIKALPEKSKKVVGRSAADRPGGKYASVIHTLTTEVVEEIILSTDGKKSIFTLMVCKTPMEPPPDKTKIADKKERKKVMRKYEKRKPDWTDSGLMFETHYRTVPAAALSETRLVVLYQPVGGQNGLLFLDVFNLLPNNIEKVDRFILRFPPELVPKRHALINIHLSARNICSICFANGVLVFDTHRAVKGIHVIRLEAENQEKHGRMVTCAPVYHPMSYQRPEDNKDDWMEPSEAEPIPPFWSGTVIVGTNKGETYGVNWRTGLVNSIEHCAGIDPVLATHYSNGKLFMMTVMSVSGSISVYEPDSHITILDVHRPIAIDTCGGLIFIMTKYGFVKILSSLVRKVARDFKPPVVEKRAPALQVAYDGIKAFQDRVVCIYPNGIVRNIMLGK